MAIRSRKHISRQKHFVVAMKVFTVGIFAPFGDLRRRRRSVSSAMGEIPDANQTRKRQSALDRRIFFCRPIDFFTDGVFIFGLFSTYLGPANVGDGQQAKYPTQIRRGQTFTRIRKHFVIISKVISPVGISGLFSGRRRWRWPNRLHIQHKSNAKKHLYA